MSKIIPAAPEAPPGTLAAALAVIPGPRQPRGWNPAHPPLPQRPEVPGCCSCVSRRL